MNDYNKYCIVCGKYSNGKPQCKECWTYSQDFIDELDSNPKLEKWNSLNSLFKKKLKQAYKSKSEEVKQNLCNELIGIGFFDEDFLNEAYEKVTDIQYENIFIENNEVNLSENIFDNDTNDYRKQNPANIYCQDGHYVRSKEERAIDDYLYREAKLLHAYEPKFRLTPNEQALCKKYRQEYEYFFPDFYIPQYNLYIEFFGKNDEKYRQKMDLKIKIFLSRKDINFKYLTYNDSNILLEKLEDILQEFKSGYREKTNSDMPF